MHTRARTQGLAPLWVLLCGHWPLSAPSALSLLLEFPQPLGPSPASVARLACLRSLHHTPACHLLTSSPAWSWNPSIGAGLRLMLVAGVGGLGMLQGKFSCLGCIQTSLSLGVLSLGREEQSVPLPTACLTVRCEMPHLLGPCPLALGSPGPK